MEELTNPKIRELLLDCINNYLGHLEYVKKNKDKYELNAYVALSLDKDIENLELIRRKLFNIEVERENDSECNLMKKN